MTAKSSLKSLFQGEHGKCFFIFPVAFLMAAGTSLLALGMIFFLKAKFHASAEQVGIYSGLWPVFYIIGCLCCRPVYKYFSSQVMVIISVAAMMVFTWLLLWAQVIQFTYFCQACYGFSIAFLWPPLMGWMATGHDGQKLGSLMSYYNLSWSTGVVVGPFLAGYLSEYHVALPIYVTACIYIGVIVLMLASLGFVSSNDERAGRSEHHGETGKEAVIDNSTPLRYPAWLSVLVGYAMITGIMTVVPIYFKDVVRLTEGTIGVLLFIRAIVFSISFIVWAKTSFWHFSKSALIGNQLVLILLSSAMCLLWHSVVAVVVLCALMGICITMCYSTSQFHGVAGSPNRTLRMTVHESILAVGMGVGAYAGGLIYDEFSFQMVFAAFAVLAVAVLLIQLGLIWRIKNSR